MVARYHFLGQHSRRSPVPVLVRFQAHLWLEVQYSDGVEGTHKPAMAGAVRGGLAKVCPPDAEGAAG